MNFLRFLINLFVITVLFNSSLFGDECQNFEDKVLSIPYPENGYVTDGQQPRYDLGLFFHQEYDYQNKKIIIKRNNKNYPIIKFSLIEKKINPGDVIKKINDQDLSKIDDNLIQELSLLSNAKVQSLKNEFNIKAIDYDFYPFNLEYFVIRAIDDIDTKKGEFKLNYKFQVSHERPDWIEAGRKIGDLTICNIGQLIENSKIYSPVTNETTFLDLSELDEEKTSFYYTQVYFKNFDKTFSQTAIDGVGKIKSNFDFKEFPFDKQELEIKLYPPYEIQRNEENNYPKPFVTSFIPSKGVYMDLEDYLKNNLLKEWTIDDIKLKNYIKSTKAISSFDKTTEITTLEDVIKINVTIIRNKNYFIFKIIIPVFVILAIAWSVMWIPTKELESRLTTSIVALLALIAYNFVLNDELPKLSYLTSLDRYILLSYLFCAIPTFLSIYFSRLNKKQHKIAMILNQKSRLYGIVIYAASVFFIFVN